MLPALGMEHLEFNRWASGEVLRCADAMPNEARLLDRQTSYGCIQGTLVHLYQADMVWLDRLNGLATFTLDRYTAPEHPAAFRDAWMRVLDEYVAWGQAQPESAWETAVAYKNQRGEAFESTVRQIVLHIVNHATYHRGQVIAMMRQAGAAVAPTDLIHYYRAVRRPSLN